MKKVMLFVMIVVAVVVALIFFATRGPDISRYGHLKDPQISEMSRQKMITVEVKGDPNVTGKDAFLALFRMMFKLRKKVRDRKMAVAPRARWPKPLDTPREEFVGIYGLAVPEAVDALPEQNWKGLKVKIEYWEYGEVAEILHLGPYDKEAPAVERLRKFIKDGGYKITGAHEEEYLKGPEMPFRSPENYVTIIRYPVKKK